MILNISQLKTMIATSLRGRYAIEISSSDLEHEMVTPRNTFDVGIEYRSIKPDSKLRAIVYIKETRGLKLQPDRMEITDPIIVGPGDEVFVFLGNFFFNPSMDGDFPEPIIYPYVLWEDGSFILSEDGQTLMVSEEYVN